MIKIRSTEKLVTSNNNGLCDLLRTMSSFQFDIVKMQFRTIVQDFLFQEQTIDKTVSVLDEELNDGSFKDVIVTVTERVIIETRVPKPYFFKSSEIDPFYQQLGTSITKTKGFTKGLIENLIIVVIAQTAEAKRQGMTNWISDTEHVLVSKFTE